MNFQVRPTRPWALLTSAALGGALLLASVAAPSVLAAGPVTHYVMSPSPVAPAASLAINTPKTVTLSAEGSTNALVPGAIVYLSFSQAVGGGSAAVGATVLTTTPVAFTATAGQIVVTYKTPAVLATGGKDVVKAGNAKFSPTISASDLYSFSRVAKYTFSPNPIAAPGTLAAGSITSVTLTSLNASSAAVAGAKVYLSLIKATGGGTASVGTTALSSTPVAFVANGGGQIVITYHAPAVLPTTGTDTVTATDATKNATLSRTDFYSFGAVHSYVLSPNPMAAVGSLAAGKTVSVTLTALDSGGHGVAGALVWIYFTPTTKGGSASVGSRVLSATPASFLTGATGTVVVTYKASMAPPLTGTDTIHIGNLKVAPTIMATVGYTY